MRRTPIHVPIRTAIRSVIRPVRTAVRRALGLAGALAFGLAVAVAVSTIAGATQASRQGDQDERGDRGGGGARVLRSEIEAMEAGGLASDDPKVRMLHDDLAALERGRHVAAPREPGVDVAATLGDRGGPSARDAADADDTDPAAVDARDIADAGLWDNGEVQCEVIPPDLLTAQDIAGATCTSTLDADGGSHYTAFGPDGVVRTVHFAPDGTITRDPDVHT
jgi:hypothetical protein